MIFFFQIPYHKWLPVQHLVTDQNIYVDTNIVKQYTSHLYNFQFIFHILVPSNAFVSYLGSCRVF